MSPSFFFLSSLTSLFLLLLLHFFFFLLLPSISSPSTPHLLSPSSSFLSFFSSSISPVLPPSPRFFSSIHLLYLLPFLLLLLLLSFSLSSLLLLFLSCSSFCSSFSSSPLSFILLILLLDLLVFFLLLLISPPLPPLFSFVMKTEGSWLHIRVLAPASTSFRRSQRKIKGWIYDQRSSPKYPGKLPTGQPLCSASLTTLRRLRERPKRPRPQFDAPTPAPGRHLIRAGDAGERYSGRHLRMLLSRLKLMRRYVPRWLATAT